MSRPDILFIVLDCVRAQDFDCAERQGRFLPTARTLAAESVVCSRAVSPASWTIPSHASMLTGVNPWEHRLIKGGGSRLASDLPTLPEALAARGYRSALFSANPLIAVENGLARGFDTLRLGSFVDCFFRSTVSHHPGLSLSSFYSGAGTTDRGQGWTPRFRRLALSNFFGMLERCPILGDAADRLLGRFPDPSSHPDHGGLSVTAPWIEEALAGWFARAPRDQPLFTFVNLLDAHEPYLGVEQPPADRRLTINRLRFRQDGGGQNPIEGDWSAEKRSAVWSLYRECIDVLDVRLRLILELVRRVRDWDNTLVVVTSDHGQAFGEEGSVYHMFGTSSALHRVPLIIKPVGSDRERRPYSPWISTSVLPELALNAASDGMGSAPAAAALRGTLERNAQRPVICFSDVNMRDSLNTNRLLEGPGRPDRFIVVYDGDVKYTVNVETGRQTSRGLTEADGSPLHAPDTTRPEVARTIDAALNAANLIRRAVGASPDATQLVGDRLRAWGYE